LNRVRSSRAILLAFFEKTIRELWRVYLFDCSFMSGAERDG
jgi:hypothetical protein